MARTGQGDRAPRLGRTRGSSAAARTDLGSCRLGNCTVGKFSLGKISLGSFVKVPNIKLTS